MTDPTDDQHEPSALRQARDTAVAEARQLREELEQQRQENRTLMFRAAGINPEDKRQSFFVKGYDGDLTLEAIRGAAEEAGFLEARRSTAPSHEEQAIQRFGQVAINQPSGDGPSYEERIRNAKSEAEVIALSEARMRELLGGDFPTAS